MPANSSVDVQGDCSGDLTSAVIVDHVVVPKSLPAGDYVVGFRWDVSDVPSYPSAIARVAPACVASG